jgi:hypothetical protein
MSTSLWLCLAILAFAHSGRRLSAQAKAALYSSSRQTINGRSARPYGRGGGAPEAWGRVAGGALPTLSLTRAPVGDPVAVRNIQICTI